MLIGGIVAFAATRILGGGDRAKVNLAKAQVQTLAEKVQQFESTPARCPARSTSWSRSGQRDRLARPVREGSRTQGPLEPRLRLQVARRRQGFDLISFGKDGKPGGTSVDADITFE